MVEVFKTNITKEADAKQIVHLLSGCFPFADINFDLDDADHILRVECASYLVNFERLMAMVKAAGFTIEVLEDHPLVIDFQ